MLEIASLVILGIFAQWIAWKTKVPAILPLILIGLLVGPISTLLTDDGSKWIEPVFTGNRGLFPGETLFFFVSLAIGIILFEGGLTLKTKEIKSVGGTIVKLITLGSIVTFVGAGLAAYFLIDLPLKMSFLFAGLIIVTGPTVIAPILRNLPLSKNIATVLKWEGILIDPIGALVAVLVYDFIISGEGSQEFSLHAISAFLKIICIGFSIGFALAYLLFFMLKNSLIPHYLITVLTLAIVLCAFVLSDLIIPESGLLTVVVMGMVLGNLDVPNIKDILYFKESLSILLISILFILLSAHMNLEDLKLLLNWKVGLLFLIIVLVLRPLGVFISTSNSDLSLNEKQFISWVGPRGIVAAGIASLFGLRLSMQGFEGAEYITPLVFMVVLGTVVLNASTARWVARKLKVILDSSDGILIVGANDSSILIGNYLRKTGRHVVLVDNSSTNVKKAENAGLDALEANVYSDSFDANIELTDIGYLMCMTSNDGINKLSVQKMSGAYGENGAYRLPSPQESSSGTIENDDAILFSQSADFIKLAKVTRDHPNFQEMLITEELNVKDLLSALNQSKSAIPLFFRTQEGHVNIITHDLINNDLINIGDQIIYLGEPLNFQ